MIDLEVWMCSRRQSVLAHDPIVAGAVPVTQLASAVRANSLRSSLGDAPVMGVDGGIDEIATEAPQAPQGAILVRRG